jgi:hypothetical protein
MRVATAPASITRSVVLVLLTLAAGQATAQRDIEYIEGAHELVLSDVDIPTADGGMLSFKPCRTCQRTTLPLSAATKYSLVGGQTLTFAEFTAALTPIRHTPVAAKTGITVYYDLGTRKITRVTVLPATE